MMIGMMMTGQMMTPMLMMMMMMTGHLTMSPELSAFLMQGERDHAAAAFRNDDDVMMMTMTPNGNRWISGGS